MSKLPYSGAESVLKLRGPASQIIELATLQGKGLAWEPQMRSQLEIEIRARIIATDLTIGLIPVVTWTDELAHGELVWAEPFPALAQIAGTPMVDHTLPARGMVFRTNAREYRINFTNRGTLTGAPMGRCVVQVSILPCSGQDIPRYPREHVAYSPGTVIQPFPMAAHEWQVTDADGTPMTGAGGVVFVGIAGALFGPVPWNVLDPWLPIPHDAVGWIPSTTVWAQYR